MKRIWILQPAEWRLRLTVPSTLLLLALGPAVAALQQTNGQDAEKTVLKRLRYTEVNEVMHVLSMFEIEVRVHDQQNTLILRGPTGQIDAAIDVLEHLDQPKSRTNLSLSVAILEAARRGGPGDLPQRYGQVAKQLSELLDYESFTLLDTVVLRMSDGTGSETSGGLSREEGGRDRYRLFIGRVEVLPPETEEGRPTVRLRNFDFRILSPGADRRLEAIKASIETNVELEEGQTAVVGKATPAGGNSALVLVVTAEILE